MLFDIVRNIEQIDWPDILAYEIYRTADGYRLVNLDVEDPPGYLAFYASVAKTLITLARVTQASDNVIKTAYQVVAPPYLVRELAHIAMSGVTTNSTLLLISDDDGEWSIVRDWPPDATNDQIINSVSVNRLFSVDLPINDRATDLVTLFIQRIQPDYVD